MLHDAVRGQSLLNLSHFRKDRRFARGSLRVKNFNFVNGSGVESADSLKGSSSKSVHGGEHKSRPYTSDSITTPIVQASTYTFQNTQQLIDFQNGTWKSHEYGRYGNPTTRVLEEKVMELECAEDALFSSSGMNSATTMLLALVPAGGHVITTTDCYRRTRQFMQTMLPKMGISISVVDPADIAGIETILQSKKSDLFFSESPTNPYLRCIDIPRVANICHAHSCIVCIDGTFSTPINQQSLLLGADIVLHSATKFLAGHNDVLAGCVAGRKDLINEVRALHAVLGGVIDPHAAYLVLRGMKTLELRVRRSNDNAIRLANYLESMVDHSLVDIVHYPGLASHPEHEVAKSQMTGFGGVISFEISPPPGNSLELSRQRCSDFIDSLHIPYIAPSLGGVESLVEQPAIISYWDQGTEGRRQLGIKENLVRFSCGIEDFETLEADFDQAFQCIADTNKYSS